MNDNDVRQALLERGARAGGDAAPPGWDDVERRAAVIRRSERVRRTTMALGAVAAAAALLVGAVVLLNDDDGRKLRTVGPAGSDSTTTSVEETTTTTEAPTTTTTTAAPVVTTATTAAPVPDPAAVGGIYPTLADYQRNGVDKYRSPEATALDFAKQYLGMKSPVGSPSRAGQAAGTRVVDMRPNSRASLTTTIVLRQASAGGPWTVTGAQAQYIRLDSPKAGAKIASPTKLSGSARAYEGHVNVEVRQEGQRSGQNLGETFVTGASDMMSPFDGEVSFKKPTKAWGAIVLTEPSADDGSTMSATVIRVTF